MSPMPPLTMHRLEAGADVFLCLFPPLQTDGSPLQNLSAHLPAGPGPAPTLVYWDGVFGRAGGDVRVHLGHGGLDPFLTRDLDLSACVAINEEAFRRLVQRNAVQGPEDFPRAVALLARSPGVNSVRIEGLTGRIIPGPAGRPPEQPVGLADSVSLALLVPGPEVDAAPFVAALRSQRLASPLDVIVIAVGFDSQAMKGLVRSLEAAADGHPRLKLRRYSVSEPMSPRYAANMAVGLSGAEAVVFADARCVPITPGVVQNLADWAIRGDAVASTPRIVQGTQLVAAGLALRQPPAGGDPRLVAWNDPAFSEGIRTAAAPAPWFFAVRRAAWMASDGLRGSGAALLWSADFASLQGPKGRTLLIGSEVAEWRSELPPGLEAPSPRQLQAFSATALCNPEGRQEEITLPSPAAPAVARPAEAAQVRPEEPAFSDSFPSSAPIRLLVFADGFGSSQSIVFIDGLAGARARGDVSIRILEEAAFPGDSRALDESAVADLVEKHVEAVQPTILVASRLGHSAVWKALREAARRRGVPILFHIDDDILELPPSLGVERYRMASNPKRSLTISAGLAAADLVLTATPALAARLAGRGDCRRIFALRAGAAGRPRPRAPDRRPGLVIGYMGSASHDHDLAMIVPALNRITADYPHVRLSLFGSIAEQASVRLLQGPIERHAPVTRDYLGFKDKLSELVFDIGLAPLRDNGFNRVKTPTKWVEYAEAGAATLASRVDPYIPIGDAGACITVTPYQWESALRRMIEDPALRRGVIESADALLLRAFTWEGLEDEVLKALDACVAATRVAA